MRINLLISLLIITKGAAFTLNDQDTNILMDEVESWQSPLLGVTGEEAKATILNSDQSLSVDILPEGSMVTEDYRLDRVRIFVGENGNVSREPHKG